MRGFQGRLESCVSKFLSALKIDGVVTVDKLSIESLTCITTLANNTNEPEEFLTV